MLDAITRTWWVLLPKGMFALLIGLYAAAVGLLEVALASRMRRIGDALDERAGPRHSAA